MTVKLDEPGVFHSTELLAVGGLEHLDEEVVDADIERDGAPLDGFRPCRPSLSISCVPSSVRREPSSLVRRKTY